MQRTIHHFGFFLVVFVALGFVVACDKTPQTRLDEADGMRRSIAQIKGAYTWRGDLGRYDYSAKDKLEEILSAKPPEYVVWILIECLDDSSASASVLDGKAVSLGIVCYEGLSQLVYYEPTDPSGDVAAQWPGFVAPKASPEEMRNAKSAWKRAQEAKLLIFQ